MRVPVEKTDGTWAEFVARGERADALAEADARAAAVSPDDISDILFTSGTTGRSKGVLCAHRQSLAGSAAWAACGEVDSTDRYLCINPFFHNFGFKAAILACLQTGATLIPQLTFDPEQAMRMVEQHRVTVLPGPPTIFQMLLDHPALRRHDLSSLRFAVTGAATIPVVLIERMQAELDFDIVLTAYGLTEASGFGTMCRAADDAVTVATTCGRPIADFDAYRAQLEQFVYHSGNFMKPIFAIAKRAPRKPKPAEAAFSDSRRVKFNIRRVSVGGQSPWVVS